MTFNEQEINIALKKKGLKYKLLKNCDSEDNPQDYLTFLDLVNGTKVKGKIVESFTEGEVYHWPRLSHLNVTPLLDVLNIRDDLNIFLTVDFPMKLKDIIHDEDFEYHSNCLDRKRAYARGIFSGLSYIHGKGLCLMNLSDDNIFICKLRDKAVITNFSFLTCSRKVTRDKLKVSELYKPPESEKGEFDATAAEMWASGTLMMDMFLAHMVPWAIIDFQPRRVTQMVDKLSLKCLQAANTGSVVSTTDLAKFKEFLKCFFIVNPLFRITSNYVNLANQFNTAYYQSKSLSFINPVVGDTSHKISVQFSCSRNCSCSNAISLPPKQSKMRDCQGSDLHLSRLFEENELNEESITGKKNSHEVSDVIQTKNLSVPPLRPQRKLSYSRAIQLSADQMDRKREPDEKTVCVKGHKDELAKNETEKNKISRNINCDLKLETTNVQNCHLLNQSTEDILNTKNIACKISPKGKKKGKDKIKKESKVTHGDTEKHERSKSFFSSCLSRKVEGSTPHLDDLCKICKLHYGIT